MTQYDDLVALDNPLCYLPIDAGSGSTLADQAGSNPLTILSGSTWANAVTLAVGYNLQCDGSIDAGARNTSPTAALAPALDRTWEIWARSTSDASDNTLFAYRVDASNSVRAYVQGTFRRLRFYAEVGGVVYNVRGPVLSLNTAYHLAWTLTAGGVLTCYVNGSAANDGTGGNNAGATTGVFRLGANTDSNTPMAGQLDSFAYYGSALSADVLLSHATKDYSRLSGWTQTPSRVFSGINLDRPRRGYQLTGRVL